MDTVELVLLLLIILFKLVTMIINHYEIRNVTQLQGKGNKKLKKVQSQVEILQKQHSAAVIRQFSTQLYQNSPGQSPPGLKSKETHDSNEGLEIDI